MKYELLDPNTAKIIRAKFEKNFIMTQQEYDIAYLNWHNLTSSDFLDGSDNINSILYWSKLKDHEKEITFDTALNIISNVKDKLYFMSDPKLERYEGIHGLNSDESTVGFVATANDPVAFSIFVRDEWIRINAFDDKSDEEWVEPLLPWDLYVFDKSFKWMIALTHHNADDFGPEYVENSFNRLCFFLRA